MVEFRTSRDALTRCEVKGQLLPQAEIDLDVIRSLCILSDGDCQAGEKLESGLAQDSILWNNVFDSYYDSLHKLVDAFVRMDKINPSNHLCLFAYICEKHPGLDLDWSFFEKIRTKRNGIQYYGRRASRSDWLEVEVQMRLYIRTMRKAVEKRISERA